MPRFRSHTPDAKFIDVLERTLYDNSLASISLSGKELFYARSNGGLSEMFLSSLTYSG